MITRRALLVGAVPLGAWSAWAAWAARIDDKAEGAARSLIDVSFWAWGGIGITATISAGEEAFFTVAQARSKIAIEAFENVYAHAKPAGRLYALLGLRDLAPARFEKLLPKSLESSATIETITGCIIDSDTEAGIASVISLGAWGIKPVSAEEVRRRLAARAVSEKPD
jgi:hypothetical protein